MKTLWSKLMSALEEERIGRLMRELRASMYQWGQIDPDLGWEPRIHTSQTPEGARIVMAYGGEGHCVEVLIRPLPDGAFEEHVPS